MITDEMPKVGDIVYVFDQNRRRYTKPAPGRKFGEIIYREHFDRMYIVGETSRSWLLSHSADADISQNWMYQKFPKKFDRFKRFYTAAQVDDECWKKENRYRIADEVGKCDEIEKLREIAKLLGIERHD